MCGRLVSAFVATFVIPRNMILVSLVTCIAAAISLYIGTAILGFFHLMAIWILFLLGSQEKEHYWKTFLYFLHRLWFRKSCHSSSLRIFLHQYWSNVHHLPHTRLLPSAVSTVYKPLDFGKNSGRFNFLHLGTNTIVYQVLMIKVQIISSKNK